MWLWLAFDQILKRVKITSRDLLFKNNERYDCLHSVFFINVMDLTLLLLYYSLGSEKITRVHLETQSVSSNYFFSIFLSPLELQGQILYKTLPACWLCNIGITDHIIACYTN